MSTTHKKKGYGLIRTIDKNGAQLQRNEVSLFSHKADCCGCHACQTICPAKCIRMEADDEGFLYPSINHDLCQQCGKCQSICPVNTLLQRTERQGALRVFAAWNHDSSVRKESSSGGIFSLLMERTFQQNGIVFGAAFDKEMRLCHQSAIDMTEGSKFKGAKYLQSTIGETYSLVKENLKSDSTVLFSGTPCQVAGLYSFLGEDHDLLLTCDLVCHGVPSPKVFDVYRAYLENRHGGKLRKISFRDKTGGWKKYSISLSFDSGQEYRRLIAEDPFMTGFLKNIYLRPSCYQCPFSRILRVADISLGDFWGVGNHHPEWDDDKGTSLVMVQSDKGYAALAACNDKMVLHPTDLEPAIKYNPCICGSVASDPSRDSFFVDLDRLPFKKIKKRYLSRPSLWRRAIGRARSAFGSKLSFRFK